MSDDRSAAQKHQQAVDTTRLPGDAADEIQIPGSPGPIPPDLAEPDLPRDPLPPTPDQRPVAPVGPTGADTGAPEDARAQQGAYLTTSQGLRLRDTDHALRAGERGPLLMQDHHFREKITHFDHERIPERVVHARGAGAHGIFQAYGTAAGVCRAGFLAEGAETRVFVRFSTVNGSRGSADTVRDTRGFSTKFYTEEGTFDLVANNIPVFFIQDGIKFPDVVHAVKPNPDREIPQAQSAHDTFWDFVSLHTEAQHHVIWQMSDRGIPRSYRTMEGFGVHTFRLTNTDGGTTLVKFHWKPKLGVHSLVWEEAQFLNGIDPDYHRRDLYDAIEAGAFPEFELGIQTFPDTPDETFEGIDLLDPTKLVPEELAPVRPIGRLLLTGSPVNFFAETEQVAFHPGHLVPGIDITDDPLLQARLFSYLDTQLSRLGGPNFSQIPVNRPHAPVNDMLRDGMHQTADHAGVAPYKPNTLDGGCPFHAGADTGAFIEVPTEVGGRKVRELPASFDDHLSQARMFWLSMSPVEQDHIVQAYTFELGKCYEQVIKERQLQVLVDIEPTLAALVAEGLGLPVPAPTAAPPAATPSPALSQLGRTWPTDGRLVGIVADATSDLTALQALREAIDAAGMVPLVIAPRGGALDDGTTRIPVQRTYLTARSVEFDAVLVAGSPQREPDQASTDAKVANPTHIGDTIDPRLTLMLSEVYRHSKPIGGWGAADAVFAAANITDGAGVVLGDDPVSVFASVRDLLAGHRVWERFPTMA